MSRDLPYRPCVGVVLANARGEVFTGERVDTPGAWQMPQGGIDKGETPKDAAFRELEEETGIPADLALFEAEHPEWITYDLPGHLIGKLWKGRFRGQKQRWFLLRYLGQDSDINLNRHHREFVRWRWSNPDQVLTDIVPFKAGVYDRVMKGFAGRLAR